uniref:Uncharacterized protein n=1 Tax=Sphaerodactylus townsendi TaxID=933632 RepID=A0ACB8FCT3_9SAUR
MSEFQNSIDAASSALKPSDKHGLSSLARLPKSACPIPQLKNLSHSAKKSKQEVDLVASLGGVIRTALPNMDREVKEQYQVLIQAKDMGGQLGGLAGTTTVNITLTDVNDNPPRFPKSKFC